MTDQISRIFSYINSLMYRDDLAMVMLSDADLLTAVTDLLERSWFHRVDSIKSLVRNFEIGVSSYVVLSGRGEHLFEQILEGFNPRDGSFNYLDPDTLERGRIDNIPCTAKLLVVVMDDRTDNFSIKTTVLSSTSILFA